MNNFVGNLNKASNLKKSTVALLFLYFLKWKICIIDSCIFFNNRKFCNICYNCFWKKKNRLVFFLLYLIRYLPFVGEKYFLFLVEGARQSDQHMTPQKWPFILFEFDMPDLERLVKTKVY